MALTDEGNGMVMPVAPMYGNGGNGFGNFGGDWAWVLLLLLALGGGWGNGFGGGFGGGLGYDFPWLLNGQNGINNNVSDGFRDAQLHDSVTSVRDGVNNLATQLCGCCGDIQMSLANGFAGTTAAVNGAANSISQQLNANELASLNRSFAEQTANTAGFTSVNAGIADTRYTIATEACATRAANTANTQMILDKLCQLELDGYKRENDSLRTELTNAKFAASQTAQTAQILAGQAAEIDGVYNRLKNCPVGTTPVYGNQPIFTCGGNNGCGCGCGM